MILFRIEVDIVLLLLLFFLSNTSIENIRINRILDKKYIYFYIYIIAGDVITLKDPLTLQVRLCVLYIYVPGNPFNVSHSLF